MKRKDSGNCWHTFGPKFGPNNFCTMVTNSPAPKKQQNRAPYRFYYNPRFIIPQANRAKSAERTAIKNIGANATEEPVHQSEHGLGP